MPQLLLTLSLTEPVRALGDKDTHNNVAVHKKAPEEYAYLFFNLLLRSVIEPDSVLSNNSSDDGFGTIREDSFAKAGCTRLLQLWLDDTTRVSCSDATAPGASFVAAYLMDKVADSPDPIDLANLIAHGAAFSALEETSPRGPGYGVSKHCVCILVLCCTVLFFSFSFLMSLSSRYVVLLIYGP